MRRGFPLAYAGMKIGLFGGTFDPAHAGHAHVAHTALTRFGLDKIWWLVTPQNPLKPQATPLRTRMNSARRFAHGAAMVVTDFEERLGLTYSIDTITALRRLYPGVRFVLILGADNFETFRHWRRWPDILSAVPIAVISRPSAPVSARFAKPFARFAAARRAPNDARALPAAAPPAWVFLPARFSALSSTQMRRRR